MTLLDIRQTAYTHPDAELLTEAVQQEYVTIYGGPDTSPLPATEFSGSGGAFFVGYLDDKPVAMGGFRRVRLPTMPDPVELKRMYVVPAHRGAGHSRLLLAHLEIAAADAGATHLVLQTGVRQPAALALYRSAGYLDVAPFGYFAEVDGAVHLGKPLHSNG